MPAQIVAALRQFQRQLRLAHQFLGYRNPLIRRIRGSARRPHIVFHLLLKIAQPLIRSQRFVTRRLFARREQMPVEDGDLHVYRDPLVSLGSDARILVQIRQRATHRDQTHVGFLQILLGRFELLRSLIAQPKSASSGRF